MILSHNLQALALAKAVVLLACNPFPDPPRNRVIREATRDRVLAGDAAGWVEENWVAMSSAPSDALQPQVARMAERMSTYIAAQTELTISRPGAAEQLMASTLPLVFVTGEQDKLTPPNTILPIVEACQNASLSILEGLGHFALLEAPDRVALAIAEGLKAVTSTNNLES